LARHERLIKTVWNIKKQLVFEGLAMEKRKKNYEEMGLIQAKVK
jgi:hypothetical protein